MAKLQMSAVVKGILAIVFMLGPCTQASPARKAPVPITHELYHMLQVFANYSSASTIHPCPNPPHQSKILDRVNVHRTTTQAVLFKDHHRKEIVVSFPGTHGTTDQGLDQMASLVPYYSPGVPERACRGCLVHQGFLKAWNSAAHPTQSALSKALKHNPSYSVVITGHSLGGALASLAASSLHGMGFPISMVVTYGQPRTGDRRYARHIDRIMGAGPQKRGKMYRVTHADDGVTQIPARSAGYQHHSTEYWEQNTKTGGQSAGKTVRCFGPESRYCSDGTQPQGTSGLGVNKAHSRYSGINFTSKSACKK